MLAHCTSLPVAVLLSAALPAQSGWPSFQRQQLETQFFAEGAAAGDLDRDGDNDVTVGPFWYEGPEFTTRHTLYAPAAFDPAGYSDHFFSFVHDFDGDGWNDVLRLGFPGKQATWYQNPRQPAAAWPAHVVFDGVDNESPAFVDLTGDGRPELVCMHQDRLGYAAVDWQAPQRPWTWHPLSATGLGGRFTHGLGVGDLDGDGRHDVLWKHGAWLQPPRLDGDPVWTHLPVKFCEPGGAQLLVLDADGDGLADVVTSEHAHGYGLVWHQQQRDGDRIGFVRHRILGRAPADNPHGVALGGLHALAAADLDGDGVTDLVTGNRYWAHAGGDAPDRERSRVLWLRCERSESGVHWTPHPIDEHSGVGTQVLATDVDHDGAIDVVVGNKMGAFVHRQRRRPLSGAALEVARQQGQLRLLHDTPTGPLGRLPRGADGAPLNLDFERGDLRDWTATGDAFPAVVTGDTVAARRDDMQSGHAGRHWLGSYEATRSDQPRGTLTSKPFVLEAPHVSFLVGGGRDPRTRVELVRADTNEVVFTASGTDDERMRRVAAELPAHHGATLFVRLVDDHSGHWGHLNFDDFRLHDAAARSGGFPPGEAAARMQLPKGFRAEVFAAEPDLHQPVAMAVDAAGRVWVAEAYSYPQRRPDGEGKDRVLVFTDRDGDGRSDERTVFLEGLNLVSGLAVGFGGVFLGQAPHLLFVPDRDGDLRPDGPAEVLLDGWHWEDTHETLNTFRWGPDGWLYGCHGVFTHSRVGRPGTADHDRVPLDAAVWRLHPQHHTFEVFAHGTSNPWGIDFDQHGQAFITACVIPHLYHVIQGGVYHRQSGRHFNPFVYRDLTTIADHRHWEGKNAHAGNGTSDAAGGGHAHSGALLYRGGRWPRQYDGALLMGNLHGHRLNVDLLARAGSGFVGSHGPDFLLAHDESFVGIALAHAHDGNVYLLDWYDAQTCHHSKIEQWDRSNGRLYKLVYGDAVAPPRDLGALPDAELVPLLFAANEYLATTARRLLQERRAIAIAPALRAELERTDVDAAHRLQALWALHGTGAFDDDALLPLCADRDESVRAFAIQFLLEDRRLPAGALPTLANLAATDPSPRVRLYLAAALQRLPLGDRWQLATALAQRGEDAADPNLPKMVWFGIEPALPLDPERALAFARTAALPDLGTFTVRRLVEAGGEALEAVLAAIAKAPDATVAGPWLAAAAHALQRHATMPMPASWPALAAAITKFDDPGCRDAMVWLGAAFGDPTSRPALHAMLGDRSLERARRERALDLVLRSPTAADRDVVLALIDDPALAERALRGLGRFADPTLGDALLAQWSRLPAERRPAAASALASRASWATALLEAVGRNQVERTLLDAPLRQQLLQLGDAVVDARLAQVWGHASAASQTTQQQIEQWQQRLRTADLGPADLPHGRAVFQRTCGACHVLYGQGQPFGPDLTGSNRKDLHYLLDNMLDPGREVARDYQLTVVKLRSGGVLSGLLSDETESAVTVRTQVHAQVVARADIASIEPQRVSLMPSGQLDGLTLRQVRDLLAYLRHDRQVPLRADAQNAWQLFGGSTLALWDADPAVWTVEDGELVGRTTTGLPRNNFAQSQLLLDDFELTFAVKLVADQGNSGVQFRSEALPDGEVKGPQADIGPGWWGKLYEEHGRGLLEAAGGEAHVVKGDWNRYRLVATGTRVQGWLNDQLCFDRDDPQLARSGVIALQVHSGGPTEVRFRDFVLTVR